MNYKVLYRKYRPDSFEGIVGQDYIITTLKNSITSGNISHAYIFSGPRGTGKTSTAKVFAKAINCMNPIDGSPCNNCDFCKNYVDNPDIIEIDAASHNGVEQIRELIENVKLMPTNGKYKVYIIDEVHMMSTSAFNALLLTLEEPPSHIVFIFATTNIENVPITILSRCQRFNFSKISVDCVTSKLSEICQKENIDIEEDAIKEIALICEGGLRDALSILDQLSKSKEKITLDIIEKELNIISNHEVLDLIDYFDIDNSELLIKKINDFKINSVEYKFLLKKLIDLMIKRAEDIKLNVVKSNKNYDTYYKVIIDLIDSLNKININIDSYALLELILFKYINNKSSDNNITFLNKETSESVINDNLKAEDTIENIDNLETNQDEYNSFINIRINNCFVDAKKDELYIVKDEYEELKLSTNLDNSIKSVIDDVVPVAASKDYIIFSSVNSRIADNLNDNRDFFEERLNRKIVFITEEMWVHEKKEYVKNLKTGVKYETIDENSNDKKIEDKLNTSLFSSDKIEII